MNPSFEILKDGKALGSIERASGRLTSGDHALMALYQKWETEGFRVLGPPATPAPEGVLADALEIVKPGPDNLGLVAIELELHGYTLRF